ncbi:TonB-dependent receptor [Asticcacaulis sp. SL142]|uniref:TonB-dependent receptor n=1 Tax=Asticcacaulis sp. SL142 TaxID=2995155 RepID=UPI00226D3992|nr:TonB-dependent receptor [Asticcacaulis sp. SL142]WAC48006.1 TonB-dependent receptor [Asticcacaulis sp. SL142]
MTTKFRLVQGLSVLALMAGGMAAPLMVQAQTQATATQSYKIAPKDVSSALKDFSKATGLQVMADPALMRGKRSGGVSGSLTAREALTQLLKGTGLSADISGGSVVVRTQGTAPAVQSAVSPATDEVIETVVVRGYASAMLDSLNDKRKNKNISDRVSADDMGNLPVENVAEALAKVPGVNAVRDSRTGEGDRITVRGLSTELNNYTMNGVKMSGAGSRDANFYRGVRLSFLPPEGISGITVHKTILPNMDGDALGGTVEIDTPTAFNYKGTHFGIALQGAVMDKFDNPTSSKAAISFGKKFNDRLGLFVTASYAKRETQFEENGGDGDSQPRTWYSDPETLDADLNDFVFRGMQIATGTTEIERKGINSSLDWRGDDHDFHLRGTYNEYKEKEFSNRLNFRNDTSKNSTRLSQVDKSDTSLISPADAIIGTDSRGNIYSYTTAQIVDRDKDGVITDKDKSTKSLYSLDGGSGTWDPQGFRLRRFWEGSYSTGLLSSLNFGGKSRFGKLTVDYDLSVSTSEDVMDGGYELEFRTDKYGWLGNKGVDVDSSGDSRYPKWVLNEAGLKGVQDPANFNFSGLEAEVSSSTENLKQAQINFTYEFDHEWLRNVKTGGKYYKSEREKFEGSFLDLSRTGTMADFEDFFGTPVDSLFDGQYSGDHRLGVVLDDDRMLSELALANQGKSTFFNGTALNPDDAEISDEDSFQFDEKVTAAYVMGEAQFGQLQVIAGARVETTNNTVIAYTFDAVRGNEYQETTSKFTNVLPSIHATYHIRPDLFLRGAIWTSFARPDIARMSSAREYGYIQDPDGDGKNNPTSEWLLASISQGNPDLKPMEAVNYDVSLEWYRGKSGAYAIAAYYKDIENFLFRSSSSNIRNGTVGENEDPNGVVISMPNNGKKATVQGIEISARQIFDWLPSPLDGFGIGFNGTFQTSEAVTGLSWHPEGYTLPLMETPERVYNLELFYEKYGWEGYIAANHQSEMLSGIQDFGNNPYEQDYTFVDMKIRKDLTKKAKVSLNVQNMFDEHTYWISYGPTEASSRAFIKNGRTISLSFNYVY